jgi:hypothetical protein
MTEASNRNLCLIWRTRAAGSSPTFAWARSHVHVSLRGQKSGQFPGDVAAADLGATAQDLHGLVKVALHSENVAQPMPGRCIRLLCQRPGGCSR